MHKKAIVKINNIEFKTEIADSFWKKVKGLAGKDFINEDEGMIFVFLKPRVQIFWMLGMRFPIDIVWIKDNQIVGIENNISSQKRKPFWKLKWYKSPEKIDKVLEITGGFSGKSGLKVGDNVQIK